MKRGRNEHIIEKNNEDRLSALSDDVLHHILSFNNAKQAVQSCILSTRWKILWKTLPTLTLKLSSHSLTSYWSSKTLERFTKFVIAILSQRDVAAPLHVLDLDCTPLQKLCGTMNNLSSVKHVTIYVPNNKLSKGENTPFILLNWLIELANIESLAVSLHTLKVLSLVPDLFNAEFSSLYNLKSLKVTYLPSSSIAKEVVDFLLQNAPLAKVTSYLD
ncbi:F-box/LRR-repeat protein [Trifolium pratense]|uniref:F-box/LRR-repeat protein n=1 Tax=Trifolium pratense TaxID=57577 RepID=A0A2K3N0Q7_TRIPR|nr:F-box/LRR-repeat protein [Trifolium pratense]